MREYEVIVKETRILRLTVESNNRADALKEAERLAGCGIDAWESQGFKFSTPKLKEGAKNGQH